MAASDDITKAVSACNYGYKKKKKKKKKKREREREKTHCTHIWELMLQQARKREGL